MQQKQLGSNSMQKSVKGLSRGSSSNQIGKIAPAPPVKKHKAPSLQHNNISIGF